MSASKKITAYLKKKGIKFDVVKHKKVYTAYDLAQTVGTKLDGIAKTLLVRAELPELKKRGKYYVVVLPASYNADLEKVKKALKASKVEFVPEKIMKKLGMEPGATSPFGSQREFGVIADRGLMKMKEALFGAESFTESLRMKVRDWAKLESPTMASFGKKNKLKIQKPVCGKTCKCPAAKPKKKSVVKPKNKKR